MAIQWLMRWPDGSHSQLLSCHRLRKLLWGLLSFVAVAGLGLAALVAIKYWDEIVAELEPDDLNLMPRIFGPPNVPRTIVLHRAGLALTGGEDDSRRNVSSVVATKRAAATIPKFTGSDAKWRDFVKCVNKVFLPYEIRIVEQRPTDENYVLVVVGGMPSALGFEKRIAGLAPYNGDVVDDPIAFVFSRTLAEDPIKMCETAAEEIGHTYGLDHEYHCKDPMTYLASCGTQAFQNVDVSCGELKKRPCKNGKPTQNTHARLLSVLGARQPKAAAASSTASK